MKIKLLAKYSKENNRGYSPVPGWPGYEYSRSTAATDYDWLVVYDEMPRHSSGTYKWGAERLECPRERTILVTQEPSSVKDYGVKFVHQFGHYLTTRDPEVENHPNYHLGRGYYWSYYGRKLHEVTAINPESKNKIISAVCSDKKMKHTCHNQRYNMISYLASTISEFDWYGRGVKPLNFKYEALDPYKYHVAIENHIAKGHCTEKLIDSILGECLTFYAGACDVGEWLPTGCFVPIPLDDVREAEYIIKSAIKDDLFSQRLDDIREAKRLVLSKYNFWAQVIKVIEDASFREVPIADGASCGYIFSRRRIVMSNPVSVFKNGVLHLSKSVSNVLR